MTESLCLAAAHQPPAAAAGGVHALCAQLRRGERAVSPDEATMDTIVEAEQRLLAALATTRARSLAEATQKLAAITRRADSGEGLLCEAELDLLHSTLADLRRLEAAATVAACG